MKTSTRLFLHWHASHKMRLGDFQGAYTIYQFLHANQVLRKEAYFAYAYCMMRLSQNDAMTRFLQQLETLELNGEEKELLLRLRKRAEVTHDGLE